MAPRKQLPDDRVQEADRVARQSDGNGCAGRTLDLVHRERTDELKRYNTALEVAGRFGYDDVVDPADTRSILLNTLAGLPPALPRTGRKRTIEPY